MAKPELLRFSSAEALVARAAEDWLRELQQTPEPVAYSVALSGGRIAASFFSVLAQLPDAPDLLRNIHFFWGDERCVPAGDPESNYRLAEERLLKPLGVPTSQIHRVRGELPPASAAAEAEKALRRHTKSAPSGQPDLDLVFLGMGEDGHVASLFPGESEEVMNSPEVYRAVVAPKPPPNRVTLGYPAITAARQVWVLASGKGKEAALDLSLKPNGKTPLGRVLAMREMTKIYTDIRSDSAARASA